MYIYTVLTQILNLTCSIWEKFALKQSTKRPEEKQKTKTEMLI